MLGGCGFIGRSVATLLAQHGREVVLADRVEPPVPIPAELSNLITWVPLDLRTADWPEFLAGVTVVHHYAWTSIPATAGEDPAGDLADNLLPTVRLLEAARRAPRPPRIVFASSGGTVYGKPMTTPVSEDHPLRPITAYGAAKAAAEIYLQQHRLLHGLDCRIARLANPFGAGQNPTRGQGAATTFAHQALRGETVTIWGAGDVVRDYIHISDAAAGLVALATADLEPELAIFNIGSGSGTSLNGILAELGRKLPKPVRVERHPPRSFDVPVSVLDISLARSALGWCPALSFGEGIGKMLSALEADSATRYWSLN